MSAASTFTTYGLDSNAFKLGFSLQRVLEWLEAMDQDIDVKEWAYLETLRPLEEMDRTVEALYEDAYFDTLEREEKEERVIEALQEDA